jgi:hypothetical protein
MIHPLRVLFVAAILSAAAIVCSGQVLPSSMQIKFPSGPATVTKKGKLSATGKSAVTMYEMKVVPGQKFEITLTSPNDSAKFEISEIENLLDAEEHRYTTWTGVVKSDDPFDSKSTEPYYFHILIRNTNSAAAAYTLTVTLK